MNPELCNLLNSGGTVTCFLADSEGNPISPFDGNSNLCGEIISPEGRENVFIQDDITLQRVNIRKSGFIVVEVSNTFDTCRSEPIPFCQFEQTLLCAPNGTDIVCNITDFQCKAFIHCQGTEFQAVEIFLKICQDVKVVHDATIELSGSLCKPREEITRSFCAQTLPPEKCNYTHTKVPHEIVQPYSERMGSQQEETFCVKTEKVFDWVVQQTDIEIRRSANEVDFICDICTIDLFVPAVIVCERTISGMVVCDGEPVANAEVFFTDSDNIVSFNPEPAITDAFGNFETIVTVPEGTDPTDIMITAETVVNNQALSVTLPTTVSCPEEACILELFGEDTINCNGNVSGNVRCGNEFIPGVEVTLTADPNIVVFNPNPALTGDDGNFFSGVTVPTGTPPTEVEITATATVDGQDLVDTIIVTVSCEADCVLTLTADPLITCEGEISGTLVCNGTPVAGASVEFSNFPAIGTFIPNPAITEADGTFTTTLTIPEGTPLTSTLVTASTTVDGEIVEGSIGIQVECPGPEECPCKFRIGVQGNAAPATVNVTVDGEPSMFNGTINVTAIECFVAAPMCNPAVDNFNVNFGDNGNTINFIQGRRIEIECEGNTFARVRGTANATGNVLPNGVYEVTITLTIGPGNIGNWTVNATDMSGNTFTTAFSAAITPITFIGDCDETP